MVQYLGGTPDGAQENIGRTTDRIYASCMQSIHSAQWIISQDKQKAFKQNKDPWYFLPAGGFTIEYSLGGSFENGKGW